MFFFSTFIVRYFHRARALFSFILNMDLGNGAFRRLQHCISMRGRDKERDRGKEGEDCVIET